MFGFQNTVNNMRLFFRFLAVLDLLASVFVAMELWQVLPRYGQLELVDKVRMILLAPTFILLLIGIYGLFTGKKIGNIAYYIQFPFRLYLSVFTVGFITLLPEALSNFEDTWPAILIKVCFMAEVIRLYLTIKEHHKLANS